MDHSVANRHLSAYIICGENIYGMFSKRRGVFIDNTCSMLTPTCKIIIVVLLLFGDFVISV